MGDSVTKGSSVPTLSAAERHRVLVEWNATQVDYPTNIPLHKFIEQQVEKTPDAVAVVYESQQLTYRELNRRANQLAHRLQKLGVGPDVLVAVCMERSLEMVVSLLAILKTGGAYVPFDPENPKERLETMLRDANPPVILAQARLKERLPEGAAEVIFVDRDWAWVATESFENLDVALSGKNLAYAIYTSGSTGQPKGVPNVHEGIVNRLLWMQEMYKLTSRDRVLQKTPFSFDVSVWEFFWPLMTGATLVMARPGGHRDPSYLVDVIAERDITTLHFVPSMLAIFLEAAGLERCRSVRQVFASGEALPIDLSQRFFERLDAELHNLYGPTEAAVDVTYWQCQRNSRLNTVPIGKPIANTQIYILDPQLEPVPIGEAGELHIGGIGLARGYLNRPELTAEKFIPDPFAKTSGARLYKTGDLTRFLPDGNVEYLGRIDHQVKLRGFRIELGEIEAVLGKCDGVRQAAVVLREDRPGDKQLVAYLIAAKNVRLDTENIRIEIKNQLPEYMVPARFVAIEEFPMTTSGKLDRKALPAPPPLGEETPASRIAPRNQLETVIAAAFMKVLGVREVGVTENFFALGGHSLTAAKLLTEIRQNTGRDVPLSALLRSATVESLAEAISKGDDGADPVAMEIQPGNEGRLPFFAIVPPGEDSLGYAMLARYMGENQKVYKIQAHNPVVRNRPYMEHEMCAMAKEYAAAILATQPEGPYCLGGTCDGTHIAERTVLELEAQNREVCLFAIFDTWTLQFSQNPWLWRLYYYQQRLLEIRKLNGGEQLKLFARTVANKVRKFTGKQPLVRNEWPQAYWPKDFVPRRFRAPVALFKRPKQPFFYVKDPEMGWGRRSEGGVEIHKIPFDHDELFREPQVRTLGKELAACVARIRRPIPMASGRSVAGALTSGGGPD